MTKLDAVNRMLRYIGELPLPSTVTIDSLEEGHEAKTALLVLEETLREEQEEVWWFSLQVVKYPPTTDGYVTLPTNVIAFESTNATKYILEGGNLYDIKNMTSTFSAPVELKVRLEIGFDNIPDVFRTYVVLVAAKALHSYLNGDETTQKELEGKLRLQRVKLERENLRQSKFNLVKGNRLANRGSSPEAVT